ncbi:MAG: WYL domain-containing protein [Chloroflexi bacterium]|nr:WYL domain-containing protein [Chloroflexota bacterium]
MRADRLLSLMLLLQANGRMTAQDLARQLEVSERTIYRDIDALSTAGVPVYTQAGINGGVFLDEHYRISLTGLAPDEVQALFVAGEAGPLRDLGLARAGEATLLKLFAALPTAQRGEVERLRQRIYIDPSVWFQQPEDAPCLPTLQQAVWEDRLIDVVYQPVEGERSARTLAALALVAKANIWYLVGSAPGGEPHTYRASRFSAVTLTDAHFARDESFDLAVYWQEARQRFEEKMAAAFPPYPATLRIRAEMLWYFASFMEGRYQQLSERDADGWIIIRVDFHAYGDALMKVLGLGTAAAVIEPDALRAGVIETARALVAAHETADQASE